MSSMLGSQSLVLATAMAVSTTVIILAFSRQKPDPPKRPLRSCLSSPDTKKRRQKKKVKFADNVKEPTQNGPEFRGKQRRKQIERSCRNEMVSGDMPANRMALYSGILRDRAQRMECSH